ncbi:uncharacterized protein LOC121770371 [Salvia splendens]|uniref:uncharacterized protein LOC121770371 n=1 Tax=Salvia splendens TaxID=180675 RepID=UPI001C25EA45|nr:uncharacterized protein LOC121770371 [Salvia splendens]
MDFDTPSNPYQHMVQDVWGQSSAHEPWQYVPPTYMPEPPINESQQFYNMLEASKSDLWAGCDYSELSTNARLMTLKSEHQLSQRAVDELCQFMEEHLPKPNRMPNGFYKCKKQMQALDMPVLKIHCCTKGCMINWKEDENRTECKVCGHARFKGNGSRPFKKMYCFPLCPRLRSLYAFEVTAQSMRWHAENAQTSGEMRHPADSAALKTFDKTHPLFASESRNVRWSTSGHRACPYCMEDSRAFSLKHGRKTTWFDCHRRFLNRNHQFRRDKKNFMKNRTEHSGPPPFLKGEEILDNLEQFEFHRVFDEGAETANSKLSKIFGWNKRSIFWDLPYWMTNVISHNLDVMHIEKNVFDNIFNTIMNVEGMTKDNANARRDLEEIGITPELWPYGGKYHKANFTLDKESMNLLLKWLNILKFPDGYVSMCNSEFQCRNMFAL